MRILIAEDEPVSLLMLESTLRTLGHEPVSAQDGVLAWARFQMEHFPIVITDWRMPGLDGLELCRRIRADRRPRYTFVIVLTSVSAKEGYLEGMRAGADDFLVKPFDPAQFEARLLVADRVLRLQTDIRMLEGLLPICSYCKRIREGKDYWEQVEAYVQKRTEARFSHSICPDCYQKHVVPELEAFRQRLTGGKPEAGAP
jgi:DNA-binding response OmpR family regulator